MLWALCRIRSHGTKSHMLVSKLHSGTSKTMQLVPVYLDLPLFWRSYCATCLPAYVILYHVTGSCKRAHYYRHRITTTTEVFASVRNSHRTLKLAVAKPSFLSKCRFTIFREHNNLFHLNFICKLQT